MSHRQVRKSTSALRRYYWKNKRRQIDGKPLTNLQVTQLDEEEEEHDQNNDMAEPGNAQPVPQVAATTQQQAAVPQPGGPALPDPQPENQVAAPQQPTTPAADGDINTRLKNMEEKFKEWQNTRASKSRSSSRAPALPTSRAPSPPARRSSHDRHPARRPRARSRSRSPRPSSSRRESYRPRTRSSSRRHSRRSSKASNKSRDDSRRLRYSRSHSRRRRTRSRTRSSSRSSRSRYHYRRRTRSRTRAEGMRRATASPPPPPRRRSTSTSRLEKALETQYPDIGRPKGRPLSRSGLILATYRNLPPELRRRASKRRSRRDLLFPEHMCGFLNTVLKAIEPDTDIYTAVDHAAQVAEDASSLMWQDVREWSQTCLTHLQDRKYTWADRQLLERERTKLSWVKGRSRDDVKIPCHDHNTVGCSEKSTHYSEGKAFLHTCAVCFYAVGDEETSHIAKKCRGKAGVRSYRDDNRNTNRWRPNGNQQKKDQRKDQPKPKN